MYIALDDNRHPLSHSLSWRVDRALQRAVARIAPNVHGRSRLQHGDGALSPGTGIAARGGCRTVHGGEYWDFRLARTWVGACALTPLAPESSTHQSAMLASSLPDQISPQPSFWCAHHALPNTERLSTRATLILDPAPRFLQTILLFRDKGICLEDDSGIHTFGEGSPADVGTN